MRSVDAPWGNTAEEALRWAFNVMGRSPAPPVVLGSLRGPSAPPGTMTREDIQMQAATIRQTVDRMSDRVDLQAYLWVIFLPKPTLERQPGQSRAALVDRFLPERQRHTHAVAWHVLRQMGTGQHRLRGYMELVTQYALGRQCQRRARDQLRIGMRDVQALRERVYVILERMHVEAMDQAGRRLVAAGLISYEAPDARYY